MAKITINEKIVEVQDGMSIMQACESVGIEIPKFCYHEKLSIAGNCRMCLVEVEKTPKLQASCAFPVSEDMVIKTNSPKVEKARKGVMEFLLINHPLDCPICDQGGECDLQDQAYHYGAGENRFSENKRSVADKEFGPLIKTHMTRCIHCTRCIRFSEQIAGVDDLGATGRGENMEVGTYVKKTLSSELSGNLIDICPVGALTSKPYAFKARSWELNKTESIDVHDAVGSNIRIDSRNMEVMRILPRINEQINEEWISDKTRFAYDGLKNQRLDSVFIKEGKSLVKSNFDNAYNQIISKIKSIEAKEIAAIAGDLADVESVYLLKKLMKLIGSNKYDCRTYGEKYDTKDRMSYLFNSRIEAIDKADFCLLVGANIRYDAPIINARLKQRMNSGDLSVYTIGNNNLNYKTHDLGADLDILNTILSGESEITSKIKEAKFPMIVIGNDAVTRNDGFAIIELVKLISQKYNLIRPDWNGFNILHKAAGRVGALDLKFTPEDKSLDVPKILEAAENRDIKLLFMLNGDEVDCSKLKNTFVVYIGHHGDKAAIYADIILPSAAYTEKEALFVNTEGRVQTTRRAIFPPGDAIEDWKIISNLLSLYDKSIKYNSLNDLRKEIYESYPIFTNSSNSNYKYTVSSTKQVLDSKPLKIKPYNFYMTDAISRASTNMANCSREFLKKDLLRSK